MTQTVDEPDVRGARSARFRIIAVAAVVVSVVLVGSWIAVRGGSGDLATLELAPARPCAYDSSTGQVVGEVSLSGGTVGESVRAEVTVTAYGGGADDPDFQHPLGDSAETVSVSGPFNLTLQMHLTVDPGLSPDSVVCFYGMTR